MIVEYIYIYIYIYTHTHCSWRLVYSIGGTDFRMEFKGLRVKTNIVIPTCTSDFSPTSHYPTLYPNIFPYY